MTERLFPTQEIGSLAKPRWLIKTLRELEITQKDLDEAVYWGKELGISNYEELIRLLRSSDAGLNPKQIWNWGSLYSIRFLEATGLDYVYDGEVRRVEMYEYPISKTSGFRFYGHVRSFDNKYYRKAACVDKVKFVEAYHLEEFLSAKSRAKKALKVPVTGPYTLADWSFNEYYFKKSKNRDLNARRREAKREFALDLATSVINPNLRALASAGAKRIQIDEPAATTHPDEIDIVVDAFNLAVKGVAAEITVHMCFGDYSLLFPKILEMKNCSQFAFEFANRDIGHMEGYTDLELFKEYSYNGQVGLGVLDVHRDEIESPDLVSKRIQFACGLIDKEKIYVNPDCGLRTRTWHVAREKLQNMTRGADIARRQLMS